MSKNIVKIHSLNLTNKYKSNDTEKEKPLSIKDLIVKGGLGVALFWAILYFCAWYYHTGILSYYGLEHESINFEIELIFKTSSSALTLLLIYFGAMFYIFYCSYKKVNDEYIASLVVIGAIIIPGVILSLFLSSSRDVILYIFKIYIVVVLISILIPVFPNKKLKGVKGYRNRWKKYRKGLDEKVTKESRKYLYGFTRFSFLMIVVIIAAMILALAFKDKGYIDAGNKTDYYYLYNEDKDQELNDENIIPIIVYQDSEYYIIKPYDIDNKKLQLTYRRVPANEIGTIAKIKIDELKPIKKE